MLAHLTVTTGPDAGRMFPLDDGQTLVIGRGRGSHTQLTDVQASRRHCTLQIDRGRFVLTDDDSASGTFVNGRQIARHELQAGDVVRVGETELVLKLDARHEKSTLVAPFIK